MTLSLSEISDLRKSHSPQPSKGRVENGLHVARKNGRFLLWDSRQTAGYLCATSSLSVLEALLSMEEHSHGSVRELITGEKSLYDSSPSTPQQDTFRGEVTKGSVKISLGAIFGK